MDKASRPVRNKRHISRRAWLPGEIQHHNRIQKRLFTPEIKRMLKDWLVRRRENPYPSRDEKKRLAINTGLTYIQICNWFANWRRKLKNVGREPSRKTWGHLIKSYNISANGNVEQFSICSGDSIWDDDDRTNFDETTSHKQNTIVANHRHHLSTERNEYMPIVISQPRFVEYSDQFGVPNKCNSSHLNGDCNGYSLPDSNNNNNTHLEIISEPLEQCFQISSTTQSVNLDHTSYYLLSTLPTKSPTLPVEARSQSILSEPAPHYSKAKYKNNIMEKYLRDCEPLVEPATVLIEPFSTNACPPPRFNNYPSNVNNNNQITGGIELSKWLESAANFTPKKNNYIEWDTATRNKVNQDKYSPTHEHTQTVLNHEREDLEAAEVLTSLAGNYRNRMFSSSRRGDHS